uniref:Uncharacterized protein n=1 Tax=Oryza meridionalis TaxID=40149 RepID=A0A0E0D1C6_9ORYZ
MAISPSPPPPPPSPSPGDPIEAARHAAAAALAVPARLWGSLLARLPSLSDRCLRRRRRPALPLPFRTAAAHSARATGETPKAFGILEDIVQHTLSSLHGIQKSLLFWQSKAEGTNSQKMYFMIFERGPRAFVKATYQTLTRLRSNESPTQYILHSASDMVSTKLAVLTNMQHCLAVFLAEGHTLLFALDGSPSEFLFERLPEIDYENSEWTEASSTDAICLIYQNLQKLDNLVCSQIISIRDELFETFKQRSKREMEKQEVQQTEESLRRMLLDFCGNTSNEKPPQDMSELAMMEIVMKRYEKEAMHPFKGLSSGKLTRALSIQIEKHKLALLEAMLELDQILRANEINFAILAALPAFGVSLLLLFAVRAWATHGRGAEGRGRTARRQRRLLLADVEKRLMEFQNCMANGMEEEACCKFGLTLYTLDRLYKAVESHARETGEWSSLREDMFDLAKPGVGMEDKLVLLSRLKGMYDCLLPSPSGVIN